MIDLIMLNERALVKKSPEALSVLNYYLSYTTSSCKKDIRKRFSFDRIDEKHNTILKSIWEKEGNIHAYMGEWHTHPEDYPNYSFKDKKNWIKIGGKLNKDKFIHIIVGNKSIGVWEYDSNNKQIVKIGDMIDV